MILASLTLIAAPFQTTEAVPPPGAAATGDKLVCKRLIDTGSIVGRRKICHTKADWEKIAWAARQGVQSLQEGGMGRPVSGN